MGLNCSQDQTPYRISMEMKSITKTLTWQDEFRSLFTNLLEADPSSPQFELTRRMQQMAGPALQTLGQAAAKFIQ